MTSSEILGALGTVITAVFGGALTLLKIYASDQKKIKAYQAKEVTDQVRALEHELVESKSLIRGHNAMLMDVKEKLIAATTRLDVAIKNEENLIMAVETMKALVDKKIEKVNETLSDGEIIRLGEGNRFMFKGKRKD